MKVRPLADKVLVQRVEAETKTAGGIVLPDSAKEKPQKGKVVAVGDGKIRLLNKSNNLIIEPINNCVHVEIEQAWLDFEPYEYV